MHVRINTVKIINAIKFIFIVDVDSEFQNTLTAANDYLQKSYINSRYSPTVDEWPPYQPRHYTTLALIHHKDRRIDATVISVTQELSVTGKFQHKVEDLPSPGDSVSRTPKIYSNTTKNISEIFVSVTASDGLTINPCIILIEGAPGIGKTVLAKEIAFQWANNNLLIDKKILFLLFLRHCNFKNMITVQSFVQYMVKSDEITACLTKYLLQTEGKDLAIVFDGYDELSVEDRKNSIIADIIHRRLFAKCCLVTTSRPIASADLHNIVDCRVEIVGFTEEDRLDYIQTALHSDSNKVEELTCYFQSNPTINALCYIPLNMTILLCLAEDGIDKLPKTQTDMYRKFIEMTIVRFIAKVDSESSKVITSITELPCPYNKMFEELAKLAYKALNIDKIVFTLDEIKHVCPNIAMMSSNWNGLGLLIVVQYFNTEIGNVTFHFLHFSIQEYMAAWYISTLSSNEQIKLLKSTFWEHRYYNTWIMYVGITHGNSFALKHFLSGNQFQITTKIFKSSRISNKFLKNKIRCLHLFQCFVESNNEDMIAPVSHFLQGNQIDLSNQTLLPSDVDTLGFFLIRSVNKTWEMLNLSGCNIGSIGINILCDRFLNKKNHNITIKAVDFSFNQLNFSSLVKLFELYKTWHTSEILITDSEEILQNNTVNLYRMIEDAFSLYDNNVKLRLQFGSFLFAHQINVVPLLLNVESIYLINCNWELTETVSKQSFHKSIRHHRYDNIHIIDTSFAEYVTEICNLHIIDTQLTSSIFVYNPALSNQDADRIWNVIGSTMSYGVRLVISNCKVQGIINTSSLNTKLSRLEILNLIVTIRALYSNTVQTYSWREDLCCHGSESDLMIDTFNRILHKINTNNCLRDLKIALREKYTLIAYNVIYKCIFEKALLTHLGHGHPLRAVYFNNCIISEEEYEFLFNSACVATLTSLYVYNCYLGLGCFTILFNKLSCKEIFIHTLCDIDTDGLAVLVSKQEDCSTLLVAKHMIFGYKPTSKQIAVALQLDPSINVLKLMNYNGTFDTFNQMMRLIVSTSINWTELDLSNCSIGEIEYDVLYRYFKTTKCFSTVNVLKLPSEKFTMPIFSKLMEIRLVWKVQELVICSNRQFISKCKSICINTTLEMISLSVISNSKIILFICNFSWDKIAHIPKVSSVYFIKCHHSSSKQINSITNFIKLPVDHISQIYIINSTLYENDILNFLEILLNRRMELSILHTNMSISSEALYFFITKKETFYQCKMSFVAVMENFMFGYNATKDQLHLLQSQKLCELEYAVVTLAEVSHITQVHKRVLFLFQNKKLITLHFVEMNNINVKAPNDIAAIVSHNNIELQNLDLADKNVQSLVMMIVAKSLKEISTLKSLNMSNTYITKKVADDIAVSLSHNTQLQELDISNNHLQALGATTLAKGLHNITTLKIFCISNNNITEEAAGDIADFVSHNTQLQVLDISNNHLQASGAITLAKGLHDITTLIKFCISNNNISEEAAGDISVFVSHNTQLQELDISSNHLQALGAITLAKGLHDITTLTKFCISNNNITEEAAGDIAVFVSHNTQLQVLDISNNHLQASGAITLAKGLHDITTLTKFCISNNNISEEAAGDISVFVSHNTQLQELDISSNHLQALGAITLAKGLHDITTLTKFCISNNNITEEAAGDIAVFVSHNIQLQVLDISNNHLQASGAITLAKGLHDITTLTKFCISNNNISEEAAGDISVFVSHNTQLQELDISSNHLQALGAITLAKGLHDITTLTKFCISYNNITEEAAGDIAVFVSHNTQLQELDINSNHLQALGAITLAKGLHDITTLTKFCISNNNITEEAAGDIAVFVSHNTQLQELDISNNHLQASGAITLAKGLYNITTLKIFCISNNNITEEAAGDIASLLHNNTQLKEVDIGFNEFKTEGIKIIVPALQHTKNLQILKINDNKITDEAVDTIIAAISCNTNLQKCNFRNNHFSVVGHVKIGSRFKKL